VQLEEHWLDPSGELETLVSYPDHVLSLNRPESKRMQTWGRYVTGRTRDYVLQRDLLFDPCSVPRQSYVRRRLPIVRSVCCYFDPITFKERTGLDGNWSAAELEAFHTISGPLMLEVMHDLFRELSSPGFSTDIRIESLTRLLTVEIERYVKSLSLADEIPQKRLAQRHVRKIRDYLDGTHGYGVTVQDLAEVCGVHPDHLRRTFRASTGQTLGAYVGQLRITKAKEYLAEGRLTLKQIAHSVGFSSPNSFCAAFRRETHETPTRYQTRVTKR